MRGTGISRRRLRFGHIHNPVHDGKRLEATATKIQPWLIVNLPSQVHHFDPREAADGSRGDRTRATPSGGFFDGSRLWTGTGGIGEPGIEEPMPASLFIGVDLRRAAVVSSWGFSRQGFSGHVASWAGGSK